MPKAFSEVPKRIYSAGRKEINILNNHRKELLKDLKDMKNENKFLLKEQKHLRRLLKEYQDEGQPYTVLLKENQFEIQSTKNSLDDLKEKFCEVQNLKNRLNAEMVACNCQMVACKKLLRLETKLGSLEILKKKLKKYTKESDVKDETIRVYRLRVSRLSEEHEKESNYKDQEAEMLKEKLMAAHDRLLEMKSKYDIITRKICNTHHHYHPDQIDEKRPRKKKTEFSQSLGIKNKPTKKKVKTNSHRIVSSTPLKPSKSNSSTSTKRPSGHKIPSNESLVRKSGKSKLICPSVGVSCMPPQTSFKLADMITPPITDTVTSDLIIAASDSSITTSDLGRSILTPDVSEEIDSIEQIKVPNSTTSDFDTTMESFSSKQTNDTGTTTPIMEDCDLQSTPIHSLINSVREEKPTDTKDEQIFDHKINDEICEQFKNLDISEDENKSNYGKTMNNNTLIDLEKIAHGIRHHKCHEPKSNSEHRKQSIKKSRVLSKHRSSQIRTQARKVYHFNETVEHLHSGTPTGSTLIKKTNQ